MKVKAVFIAHPLRGNLAGNVRKVRAICKELHTETLIPYAPYLATIRYLSDDVSEERWLGMMANNELLFRRFIDEVWLYGNRISAGMAMEVKIAHKLNIPVVAKTEETSRDLEALMSLV